MEIVPCQHHRPPLFIIAVLKHEALVSGVEEENPDNLQARKENRGGNKAGKLVAQLFPDNQFL